MSSSDKEKKSDNTSEKKHPQTMPPEKECAVQDFIFDRQVDEKTVKAKIWDWIRCKILLEENGLNKLYEKIVKVFPKNKRPDKRRFKKRIANLIWINNSIDGALQKTVRSASDPNDAFNSFTPLYPFIPRDWVEDRIKFHKGLVSGRGKKLMGKSLPGIGRIDLSGAMPDFQMPKTSFSAPVEIKAEDQNNWSVQFLNGANMGVKYGPDIVGNVVRRALSQAEQFGDDAVIITNMITMDLKKAAGPTRAARAMIYGTNINPELITDGDYREIVKQIIADKPRDEIIFVTPEEAVNDLLGGWSKVCTKPNNHPEYTGPVYIVLGLMEIALVITVAYWEVRWHVFKRQRELREQISLAKKAEKDAQKRLTKALHSEGDDEGGDVNIDQAYEEIQRANQAIESLRHQLARTNISDIPPQEWQRFVSDARCVVIKKIEESIPNSKVIGESSNYISIGGKKVEIHIPSHLRVGDNLLGDYNNQYGPKALRRSMADAVVICHPSALQPRGGARELDHDGQRDSGKQFVAPVAVDEEYLRSAVRPAYSQYHPLMRAVYSEMFRAGVMRLKCTNGIIDFDDYPVSALEAFKKYPKTSKSKGGDSKYTPGSKNIFIFCCSDQHWGGRSKEFVTDTERGVRVGMAEAVMQMMRRDGLFKNGAGRVHLLATPDDPTQAQNVAYRTRQDPHHMPFEQIERLCNLKLIEAVNSRKFDTAISAAKWIKEFVLRQVEKRGSDYLFEQMQQMLSRHIEANRDAFSAILLKAQKSGLIVRGVGEFVNAEYSGFDSRNIGIINIGSGDRHFGKTVNWELTEGPFYSMRLRDLLLQTDEWRNQKEYIDKHVVTPLYGQSSIGWGTIRVKDKYEYGLELRSSPTNMAGWGDPLRGHVKRDLCRGNYSRIFENKLPVIKIFGDKHFFSHVSTSSAIYHMSPAAVHTDEYGETGFPPNNTGVSFLGIPIDGPDSGPIIVRTLLFNHIKDYMENPRPFDWESFLPNPA